MNIYPKTYQENYSIFAELFHIITGNLIAQSHHFTQTYIYQHCSLPSEVAIIFSINWRRFCHFDGRAFRVELGSQGTAFWQQRVAFEILTSATYFATEARGGRRTRRALRTLLFPIHCSLSISHSAPSSS